MFVYNVGIAWVCHWSEVILLAMLVFNWSRHSCHQRCASKEERKYLRKVVITSTFNALHQLS